MKPERPSQAGYSKEDYGQSWSSQEWKSGAAAHDESGKPEKTSWDMMQQVAPHREEPLLDGNVHSVRYGEIIHGGSGKPDSVNYQEVAESETFIMGSDAAEFVNKVKDQEQSSSSTHTVKEQFVPEENRDIASFNADNEFNRAINEENIDFNIPGLPHSAVKQSHDVKVRNLIQKIENHPQRQALQSDLQQNRQFNPFSKESQDVIKAAGNTELCELLDVEPKAQCKVCLSYGIVYCTCGHFLRDDTTENKKYIKSVLDLFSIPHYYIRKGRPHGHRYGKKEGDQEYHTANQLQKKCTKREFLSIHDRFIRDARFRKTMIELGRTEEVIREMDKLANEDHTHHAAEEELNVYRSNWWIRSNFVGSDTMPIRHRADFKEALSTLRRLKNEEDQAYYQNWWQSSSSSWWNWQDSWWHPSSETSPRRWTQH